MVFPIADDNTDRRSFPVVNITLIVLNILVFALFQGFGTNDRFTYTWSTVPREIVTGQDWESPDRRVRDPRTGRTYEIPGLQPLPIQAPFAVYLTLLTSMFMHGGLAHIAGNMWFLWIFGDNIEDALGHARYVIFYLVCGLLASLAHVFFTVTFDGAGSPEALVPSLGASGAISGVLGSYLLLFPHKRVTAFIPLGMLSYLTQVPALVAIGMWFVFQLISGLGMLGGSGSGGVAYAAHIGGFVAGMALIFPFKLGVEPQRYDQGPRWHRHDPDSWSRSQRPW